MSFTQKERRNIGVCNGCDKRCALGVHQETTDNAGPIVSMWPTIAGKKIEHFINDQDQSEPTIMTMDANNNSVYLALMRETQIEKARTIARLCDHYKTR